MAATASVPDSADYQVAGVAYGGALRERRDFCVGNAYRFCEFVGEAAES